MSVNVQIVFYSMYGHIYTMAEAVAEGVREVEGAEVTLLQVPELVPEAVLEKSGAAKARSVFKQVPVAKPEQLTEPDAIIFGTPTRYGNMCGQMRNFIDQLGPYWQKGAFEGKVGSVFASSNTQHGGQETTITSFHISLFHLGMIVVGVPYSETRQMTTAEMTGGTPYGATTIAGDGSRRPSANELAIARFQGRHVAAVATALKRGRTA
jgi:NAD(P)H dehydrogenase (quinone)